MPQRHPTGNTRISKETQARLFAYVAKNYPYKFSRGVDSSIVSDAVDLWLDVMDAYTLPEFVELHKGKSPAEVVQLMLF